MILLPLCTNTDVFWAILQVYNQILTINICNLKNNKKVKTAFAATSQSKVQYEHGREDKGGIDVEY